MATATTMTAPADDLNPPPAPERVYYSLGRMLGVDDFQADQDYHRSSLARALLQLCGTGTVSGLNVCVTAIWQPNTNYPADSFVLDSNQNVQVNTGAAGTSGSTPPAFATAPGGTVTDGTGIVWTNYGQIIANGWRPNTPFPFPAAIVDSNNNVQVLNGPPVWQPNTSYANSAFIYDANGNVQVNTGAAGVSGATQPKFATTPGGTIADGASVVWTCEGPVNANGWLPQNNYTVLTAIVDSNGNVQILTATLPFTSAAIAPVWNTTVGGTTSDGNPLIPAWTCAGPAINVQILSSGTYVFTSGAISPVWSTAIGSTTLDGSANLAAWTCVGPYQSEVQVTAGLAIDRVGRMIVVPNTVCIRMQNWLNGQSAANLNNSILQGKLWMDVFATFAPCTRGVTPSFASQDDYDATDAYSANRMLDSFAMQLVLRTDASSITGGNSLPAPRDPWSSVPLPTGGIAGVLAAIQQSILSANTGPAAYAPFASGGLVAVDVPSGVDSSSVFLARISIPATPGAAGQPPAFTLSGIQIVNNLRLFVYPPSLVARSLGFTSGAET